MTSCQVITRYPIFPFHFTFDINSIRGSQPTLARLIIFTRYRPSHTPARALSPAWRRLSTTGTSRSTSWGSRGTGPRRTPRRRRSYMSGSWPSTKWRFTRTTLRWSDSCLTSISSKIFIWRLRNFKSASTDLMLRRTRSRPSWSSLNLSLVRWRPNLTSHRGTRISSTTITTTPDRNSTNMNKK